LLNKLISQSTKSKGLFITFEGGEGVGKTTQINLLKSYLLNINYKVVCSREPGGTIEGEQVRKLLVSGSSKTWDPMSEALMFNASRRQHINKIIFPSLKKGNIVLCDRFIDSTIVYQGYAGSIEQLILKDLHKKFCYNLYPDLTFFLDLDASLGLKRTRKRSDYKEENRFENFGLDYHNKISKGFNNLANNNKERIITIDASQSIEQISKNIINSINLKLEKNV
jgi:dTMP kinase